MPPPFNAPASQTKVKVSGIPGQSGARDLTLKDDFSFTHRGVSRTMMDGAHTDDNLYLVNFQPGKFTITVVPRGDISFIRDIENSTFVFNHANRRSVTMTGVTFATDDGLVENTTQGTTNELTFGYEASSDTLADTLPLP